MKRIYNKHLPYKILTGYLKMTFAINHELHPAVPREGTFKEQGKKSSLAIAWRCNRNYPAAGQVRLQVLSDLYDRCRRAKQVLVVISDK